MNIRKEIKILMDDEVVQQMYIYSGETVTVELTKTEITTTDYKHAEITN